MPAIKIRVYSLGSGRQFAISQRSGLYMLCLSLGPVSVRNPVTQSRTQLSQSRTQTLSPEPSRLSPELRQVPNSDTTYTVLTYDTSVSFRIDIGTILTIYSIIT